jgi:predicted transcriptional regulator YdeE
MEQVQGTDRKQDNIDDNISSGDEAEFDENWDFQFWIMPVDVLKKYENKLFWNYFNNNLKVIPPFWTSSFSQYENIIHSRKSNQLSYDILYDTPDAYFVT